VKRYLLSVNLGAEEFNNVTNSNEVLNFIIFNGYVKSFFAKEYEVGKLKGVDAEVIDKFCGSSYFFRVYAEFFYEKCFYSFKHWDIPPKIKYYDAQQVFA